MRHCTTLVLTGMALLGLAIAVPQTAFAQSDPFIGVWQLNVAKSKFSFPPPKSQTVYLEPEGQNIKEAIVNINAGGNPARTERLWIFDGMPRPSTGDPNFDAIAFTRPDANTVIETRLRAGQMVQTLTIVLSADGKTVAATGTGTNANGRPFSLNLVFEKQ